MTAVAFLRMLKALRRVILQDAAAMLIQSPDRKDHCFFRHPLFSCSDFVAFCEDMKGVLCQVNPPADKVNMDSILPGVNSRFDRIEVAIKSQQEMITKALGCLHEMDERSSKFQSDVRHAATILAQNSTSSNNVMTAAVAATTGTTQGVDGIPDHEMDSDFETAQRYVMIDCFQCVQQMVDCWFGTGDHRNLPIKGGISECEKRWKNKWRKHWDVNTNQKKLSRLRTVVLAINGDRGRLGQLEHFWQKTQSLYGLVKECESLGYRSATNRRRGD